MQPFRHYEAFARNWGPPDADYPHLKPLEIAATLVAHACCFTALCLYFARRRFGGLLGLSQPFLGAWMMCSPLNATITMLCAFGTSETLPLILFQGGVAAPYALLAGDLGGLVCGMVSYKLVKRRWNTQVNCSSKREKSTVTPIPSKP